ncbi:MAG: hypothetical protein ACXVCY_13895 [Pseudobdellovibrionaceae bacterium]
MNIFFFLFVSLISHGGELATNHDAKVSSTIQASGVVELGGCKSQKISDQEPEEIFARKEAEKAGISREEILARLIYSESLSSGYWKGTCQAKSGEDVMAAVGWGVINRVHERKKNSLDVYSDVVFAKMQFRTSFSSKKENPFAAAFLCPLRSQNYLNGCSGAPSADKLYKTAQDTARKIIEEYEKTGIPKDYKGITNFFYPKSEFFGEMRPSWAKESDPTKNKGYVNILNVTSNPCVEYYRLKK